ncbi:MAG: zinc-binding dehydrogenase [Ruminiclostridium sp.]|nr:zinc-binding dehydrogenase [Ruminiclostridium sp.]
MEALVKVKKGAGNVEIRNVSEPVCKDNEVKILIKAAGICGTDLHIYEGAFDATPPVILGHEFCGEIADIGRCVTKFKQGDRVTAENVCSTCGACDLCKDGHYALCYTRKAQGVHLNGAFTKYVTCREEHVYKIPDQASFEEGAMSEPLTCCVHAVLEQGVVHAGDVVVVSGPGAIGLICAQLAKAEGAFVILAGTEEDHKRMAIAGELGIDLTVNIRQDDLKNIVDRQTSGVGADAVLECSGAGNAVNAGLDIVRKRGRFVQVGLSGKNTAVDFDRICSKELIVTGAFSHTRRAWEKGLYLLGQGKINLKPLITRIYPLSEWEKAFEDFRNKKGIKMILTPME